MEDASMFHDGMRALQDEFDGRRVANALERRRKHREFWPDDIALITEASFFFVASHHGDAVDCSFKGGMPGFVQVVGPAALEWPDYDGNSMYRICGAVPGGLHISELPALHPGAAPGHPKPASSGARRHAARPCLEVPRLHSRRTAGR